MEQLAKIVFGFYTVLIIGGAAMAVIDQAWYAPWWGWWPPCSGWPAFTC